MIWIDKFSMRVLKWTMAFNLAIESSVVLVWIRFPELTYCLFHKSALVEIVSSIGKPLKLDHEIKTQSRPAFVKIYVKMDILAEKPSIIAIAIEETCINQKVVYKNIPRYSVHFKHLGHDTNGCKWIKLDEKEGDSKTYNTDNEAQGRNLGGAINAQKSPQEHTDKLAPLDSGFKVRSPDGNANNEDDEGSRGPKEKGMDVELTASKEGSPRRDNSSKVRKSRKKEIRIKEKKS